MVGYYKNEDATNATFTADGWLKTGDVGLMDENAFAGQQEMEQFLRQMEERIPAGTELELVLLKQGIQLGWHTYLGLNSRVGGYVPAVVDQNITIHYDTMIGGTNHES